MKHLFKSIRLSAFLMLFVAAPTFANINKDHVNIESQQDLIKVTGVITDTENEPVAGAQIMIVDVTTGVIAGPDGSYTIEVEPTDKLEISFIGKETQFIPVGGRSVINVMLQESVNELDEVTVVAFGKQKKESVISSIQSIKSKDLKVPSSNLTTAFAGRMSGIISYQRSGEPGENNAEFFVRGVTTFGYKKSPLILIDNIESTSTDLSRLNTDDIAGFSIMKDAAATSLYGARGANGVVLITTKEGTAGKAKVSVRFENSISAPTQELEFADPYTYMDMHNEAFRTRSLTELNPYSKEKVEFTKAGIDPVLYPVTNWSDEMFKDYTMNQRFNFNVSGGGRVARYYLAASASSDNGILTNNGINDFNTNIKLNTYTVRSNININITKTTKVALKISGSFDDYTGPIDGGSSVYNMVMKANPVRFPAFYEADDEHAYTKHILFGNEDEGGKYINPYAEMVSGYKDYSRTGITLQAEVTQDLSKYVDGLSLRALVSTTRKSFLSISRGYRPFYYEALADKLNGGYTINALNEETGTEYLDFPSSISSRPQIVSSSQYMELAALYNKTLADVHGISVTLIYIAREALYGDDFKGTPYTLQESLPYRNLGLSGRLTYSYDSRYFAEANFGYNGSERFHEDNRWGFFPSAGAGWIVSNESFWNVAAINNLKLKGTYGLTGNDAIGSANDRFFYLSQVEMNDGTYGSRFGKEFSYSRTGMSIGRYANPGIAWEKAYKTNIGVELGLWNSVDFQVDFFKERRTSILEQRLALSTNGFQANSKANIGEAASQGIDGSIDVNKQLNKDLWIQARVNFTYAVSEFVKKEEPDYTATPWLSRVGSPIKQEYGLIAERLFVDDADVANSPRQEYNPEKIMGGDIKYKDVDGDGFVNNNDRVALGYPTVPEIVYGFGVSAGYKSFDISMFFQGSARSSFWIDPVKTSPFVETNVKGKTGENGLLKVYADDYWSESSPDQYALWPRLDSKINTNNTQRSSWFMQDGTFIRLKALEFGYSIPKRIVKNAGINQVRFYYSGSNLFVWSKFKLWDPEMGGNGLGYPNQRVHNLGVQVSF